MVLTKNIGKKMKRNKYNLSRSIPTEVKRTVRQKYHFGCVFCACPIIEYEHVDPLFSDAKTHDPSCICLLCPTCHAKVTKKQISKDLVKAAMQDPAALKKNNINDQLMFTENHPTVVIGGATFSKCTVIIQYGDIEIISIRKEDDRYFLNAKLWDHNGKQTLSIINNEWIINKNSIWDLTIIGNRISIHEKNNKPTLIFTIKDCNTFIIEKINMKIGDKQLIADQNILKIGNSTFKSFSTWGAPIGFLIL